MAGSEKADRVREVGAMQALESLLAEMEKSLDAGRQHEITCAFGVRLYRWEPPWTLAEELEKGIDQAAARIQQCLCNDATFNFKARKFNVIKCISSGGSIIKKHASSPRNTQFSETGNPFPEDEADWFLYAEVPLSPGIVRDFEDQGESADKAARLLLESLGSPISPALDGLIGWLALVCQLAIAFPDAVTYKLRHYFHTDRKGESDCRAYDLFHERDERSGKATLLWEPFAAAIRGEPAVPPGFYLLAPSRDIRRVSIEAVRLLLKMGSSDRPAGTGLRVECNQNDLLHASDLDPHRAGYAEQLRDEGVLLDIEKSGTRVTAVTFSDTPRAVTIRDMVIKLIKGRKGRKRGPG